MTNTLIIVWQQRIIHIQAHPSKKSSQNKGRQRRVENSIDEQREAIEENSIEGT